MPTSDLTPENFYDSLRDGFMSIIRERGLSASRIDIRAKSLTPEEAIGQTKRRDFPILTGKEVMLQAEYKGASGQVFTDSPAIFSGTLEDILELDIESDAHARSLFIAALNAVMRRLGLAEGTLHCKNDEPERCAGDFAAYIEKNFVKPKIALVGYQPALLEKLSSVFELRVLDLNPDNIGKVRYGIRVEHGVDDYGSVVRDWAELVLCTGSTLTNGSVVNFIGIGKPVLFFGITIAGAAAILGLHRVCFCGG
jgi:hypothetical protein